MQGDGAHEMRYLDIADGVHLRLDEDQHVDHDPAVVGALLGQPREEAWAGLSLPPVTVLADLDLWLATRLTSETHFVVLSAQAAAVQSGIVAPGWRFGTPATLDHDATFAYRSALRWTDRRFDLGAYAHGPAAAVAAARLVEHMRAWVDAGNPTPRLHVLPAHTPDGDLPNGAVLDKRHSRLVVTFTPEQKGTP
jgi:protein-L-isoaspartate(D-aspartate) O-methyltransferase